MSNKNGINNKQKESRDIPSGSLLLKRKQVVDLYLTHRKFGEIMSDEDQIALKKLEKEQLITKGVSGLYFIACIGYRFLTSSKRYNQLYGTQILPRLASKLPHFVAHCLNGIAILYGLQYQEKFLLEKSLNIIKKYDPEASQFAKYNSILI